MQQFKKIILVILAGTLSAGFFGCGQTQETDDASATYAAMLAATGDNEDYYDYLIEVGP